MPVSTTRSRRLVPLLFSLGACATAPALAPLPPPLATAPSPVEDARAPLPSPEPRLSPLADTDADGRPDAEDACPEHPELYNDVEDDDGCPDAGALGLRLTPDGTRLVANERLRFGLDGAQILQQSQPLLDEITRIVLRNGHLGVVSIEVHSDSVGSAARNLELTQSRAEALREHLLAAGVPADRVRARGFGEANPISHCPDGDRSCRRRVELRLEPPTSAGPP